MRKKFFFAAIAIACAAPFAFAGCSIIDESAANDGKIRYKVTFVQTGQKDVVKEVESGRTLTDIPAPKEKTGYTVVWEQKDYTDIRESFTVYALEKANEYTLVYDAGELADDKYTVLERSVQTVTYDAPYDLCVPECYGYTFVKWVVTGTDTEIGKGIWTTDGDLSLTAVWSKDLYSSRWWSGNY